MSERDALIVFEQARFADGGRRAGPLDLTVPRGLTAWVGDGAHVTLGALARGTRADGTFLGVAGGRVRWHGGGAPFEPCFVDSEARLPAQLRGAECLDVARAEHDRDPGHVLLERFGVGSLAMQSVRTMSRAERRTVLMVHALTARRAHLRILIEPTADIAVGASAAITRALRDPNLGATLFATSSIEEARSCGAAIVAFERGAAWGVTPHTVAATVEAAGGYALVTRAGNGERASLVSALVAQGLDVQTEHGYLFIKAGGSDTSARIRDAVAAANVPVEALLSVAASRPTLAYAAWLAQQASQRNAEAETPPPTGAAAPSTGDTPSAAAHPSPHSPRASEGGAP